MNLSQASNGCSGSMLCLKLLLSLAILLLTACAADNESSASSAAFIPDDPNFVVVPEGELPPLPAEAGLQSPERLDALIKETIKRGDDQRNPRYYGYAEGMVRQQLEDRPKNPGALLVLADLLQKQHAFEEAEHIYEQVMQLAPGNPQAFLSMAMLARQRGDFEQMEEYCKQLLGRAEAEVAAICLYAAQGLQGQLEISYEGLTRVLERPLRQVISGWAQQEAAEMTARLAQPELAEAHWAAALRASEGSIPSAELLTAVADHYRHQQQPLSIVDLLANETEMPALAMRLAAAEIDVAATGNDGDPEAVRTGWVGRLKPWVEAWTARGEQSHDAELAFFLFAVKGEPQQALAPAFAQWSRRKEPQDTLLLLEIISSLGEESEEGNKSLRAVQAWQKQTAYEDSRLPPVKEASS